MGPKPKVRLTKLDPLADVQVELTAMVFDRVLPTLIIGGIAIVGATIGIAWHYHDPRIWRLTAAMFIIWLSRLTVVLRFPAHRIADMDTRTARRWDLLYGSFTALHASMLGISTLMSNQSGHTIHFQYCLFGSFLYCNGICARLGTRPSFALLQGGVMLAPLVIVVLQSPDAMMRWSALFIFGYAASYWEAVKVKFDSTLEQLRTRRTQRDLAEHDALTGLVNRRLFETRLNKACQHDSSFAVFFLDLDGFKKVNDTFGHAAGDILLQHVAQRLQGAVRGTDVVARFGGDEFAILQTADCTAYSAQQLAARILELIAAPFAIDGHDVRVGTSIGIELSHAPHREAKLLLSHADSALYEVKHSGKGQLRFAAPAIMELVANPG